MSRHGCERGSWKEAMQILNIKNICKCFSLTFIFLLTFSCGGGTEGTGGDPGSYRAKVLSGTVVDSRGRSVSGAEVNVVKSGEKTTTSDDGKFSLVANLPQNGAELGVERESATWTVKLGSLTDSTAAVGLRISLPENSSIAHSEDFEMTVNNVGGSGCEGKFSEPRITQFQPGVQPLVVISQISPIDADSVCLVEVELRSGGVPGVGEEAVLSEISTAFLSPGSTQDARVVTSAKADGEGVATISFPFKRLLEASYFSIEAPSQADASERLVVIIDPLK